LFTETLQFIVIKLCWHLYERQETTLPLYFVLIFSFTPLFMSSCSTRVCIKRS